MLFQPTPLLWSCETLTLDEIADVADQLAHSSPLVRPIFECVKIYVKLDEASQPRYARHVNDFVGVEKDNIIRRIKDDHVREAVDDALGYVEETLAEVWPFRPGSASWCLLEILDPRIRIAAPENPQQIIIREALRIDINGNKTSSPLLKRMFARMGSEIASRGYDLYIIDPAVYLRNISGTGVYTELKSDIIGIGALEGGTQLKISELSSATRQYFNNACKKFADGLFLANSGTMLSEAIGRVDDRFCLDTFPGINVVIGEQSFRLSGLFLEQKKRALDKNRKAKKRSFPPPIPWRS